VLKFARKQLDHAVRITKHHDSSASASASSDRADSPSLPVDQTQQFHELLASLKSAVNWASVFTYTGMRSLMIVPSSSVNNPALLFSGPGDSSATDETFFDYASGRAISTYPLRATGGLRDGVRASLSLSLVYLSYLWRVWVRVGPNLRSIHRGLLSPSHLVGAR